MELGPSRPRNKFDEWNKAVADCRRERLEGVVCWLLFLPRAAALGRGCVPAANWARAPELGRFLFGFAQNQRARPRGAKIEFPLKVRLFNIPSCRRKSTNGTLQVAVSNPFDTNRELLTQFVSMPTVPRCKFLRWPPKGGNRKGAEKILYGVGAENPRGNGRRGHRSNLELARGQRKSPRATRKPGVIKFVNQVNLGSPTKISIEPE